MDRDRGHLEEAVLVGAFALMLILASSGCGGQTYSVSKQQDQTSAKPVFSGETQEEPSDDDDDEDGDIFTPPEKRPETGVPPLSFRVGTIGYNSVTLSARAGKILKVQFTPGQQDENVKGTSFTPIYSRLGVYINIGGASKPTPMLSNGLTTGTPSSSSAMDFSSGLPCAQEDDECRRTVAITVTKPNYDYWCYNFGTDCPWTHIWETHPWHGTLEIETDDTDPL